MCTKTYYPCGWEQWETNSSARLSSLQWFSYGGNGNTNFIIVVSFFLLTTTQPGGTVKGRSNSPSMDDLVKVFYSIEVHLPSFWWIERVPSKSNPADEPSRLAGQQASIRWGAHFIQGFPCQEQVAGWLVQAARNRSEATGAHSVWKRGMWKPNHSSLTPLDIRSPPN